MVLREACREAAYGPIRFQLILFINYAGTASPRTREDTHSAADEGLLL
jgi:hypothetical protein